LLRDPGVQYNARRPIAELSSFGWMTGTWHARNNSYVFAFTMKGRWLFGADGKAADYFYLTYDAGLHGYTLVRIESLPSYGIWLSTSGWQGDRIEFTSDVAYVAGRPYHRRLTILRSGARAFSIREEELGSDGRWITDDTITLGKE